MFRILQEGDSKVTPLHGIDADSNKLLLSGLKPACAFYNLKRLIRTMKGS